MGNETSKAVRSGLENSTLADLLSDKKYIQELSNSFPPLDENAKENLRDLVKVAASLPTTDPANPCDALQGRNPASESDPTPIGRALSAGTQPTPLSTYESRIEPLWKVEEEDIAPPQEFEKWKADPSTFLCFGRSQIPSSPENYYEYARDVLAFLPSTNILWRFVTTIYYDMTSLGSSSTRYSIENAVSSQVTVIYRSTSHTHEKVKKEVTNWITEGKRYRLFANKLGGTGCFFLYPDIHESIWRKYLPQGSFDTAANHLQKMDIFKKAQELGAVDLADKIENALKKPFEAAMSTEIIGKDARTTAYVSHHLTPLNLLFLIYFMVGSTYPVEGWPLTSMTVIKKRWTPFGELQPFAAGDLGIDQTVIAELEEKKFQQNLGLLEASGYIRRDRTIVIIPDESVRDIERFLRDQNRKYWKRQTFLLLLFVFAGSEFSYRYYDIGRAFLPAFRTRATEVTDWEQVLEDLGVSREVVVDALLQASNFSTLSWKSESIRIVEGLAIHLDEPLITLRLHVRQSVVLRLSGKRVESNEIIRKSKLVHQRLIERLTNNTAEHGLLRTFNAIYGQLIASQALNLLESEFFNDAINTLRSWEPLPFPHSTYEASVQAKNISLRGLTNMNCGNFEAAEVELESATRTFGDETGTRYEAMANLSDVYCELGRIDAALTKLSEPIIQKQSRCSLNKRHNRRLLVSFAEASVWAGHYNQAEADLHLLRCHFDNIPSIERWDEPKHIRVFILLAQNYHLRAVERLQWIETVKRWENVVGLAEKYTTTMDTVGWDFGMICFSICHAAVMADDQRLATMWFERGSEIFQSRGHFWKRGMTTYWLQFILKNLPQVRLVKGFGRRVLV